MLQPCHLFLPWLCRAVLQLQLAQGTRCMGTEHLLPVGTWHTPCAGLGTTVPIYGPRKQKLCSPVLSLAQHWGVHPGKAAAMARNFKAGTGPPQSSQPLIVSRHPVVTPHLHLIYSMEPAGPREMAAVGAVVRTVLPLAEAGTLGLLLEEQLTPQSWLWPGQLCGASVEDVAGGRLCQSRRQRSSAW